MSMRVYWRACSEAGGYRLYLFFLFFEKRESMSQCMLGQEIACRSRSPAGWIGAFSIGSVLYQKLYFSSYSYTKKHDD
jgi:ABC-type phosphate/phosphonate transport system permease subunit